MSKYLVGSNNGTNGTSKKSLLGELGVTSANDDTSFEQRLFPMDQDEENMLLERHQELSTIGDEKSLDYSLPTALM